MPIRTFIAVILFSALALWPAFSRAAPSLDLPSRIIAGVPFYWSVSGLTPGQAVRVHAVGRYERWEPTAQGYGPVQKRLHGWADFTADDTGRVTGATSVPTAGSYRLADTAGLIWSAYVEGDAALPSPLPADLYEAEIHTDIRFSLEIDGRIVDRKSLIVQRGGPDVTDAMIRVEGVSGWFATRTGGAAPRAAVIILHGSEGGAWLGRDVARDYAAQGFAVLALDYFAPSVRAVPGLPTSLENVPLETLERARAWLVSRPEVDATRIAIVGTSRGGELALLAGVVFDWPSAVIGCVPSDVVTDGYGETEPTRNRNAWTLRGEPLPSLPFLTGSGAPRFASGADAFRASFLAYPERLSDARIRAEGIRSPLLLLGGDADTVWPSGEMVRRIVARRADAGLDSRTEAHVYPGAGHQICGTGLWPLRIYGVDGEGDRNLSMLAEGEANQEAWRTQIRFLKDALR